MKEVFLHKIEFKQDEFKEFITKMIYIAQAIGFPKDNWVTKKELELLIELIRQYYAGISLDSRESILDIIENTSFSGEDKGIYIYRKHLIDKGWVNQTIDGFDLIPFLKTLEVESEGHELIIGINSL